MASTVELVLATLNVDRKRQFALSYNAFLQAYCVVQMVPLDGADTYHGRMHVEPYSNNHHSIDAALTDALTLFTAGH